MKLYISCSPNILLLMGYWVTPCLRIYGKKCPLPSTPFTSWTPHHLLKSRFIYLDPLYLTRPSFKQPGRLVYYRRFTKRNLMTYPDFVFCHQTLSLTRSTQRYESRKKEVILSNYFWVPSLVTINKKRKETPPGLKSVYSLEVFYRRRSERRPEVSGI